MPRPNVPLRGGPHPPQTSGNGSACPRCRELAAELERVKQNAAKPGRNGSTGGFPFRGTPPLMVWAALGVCGVGVLFALLALIRHA